MSQCPNGHTSGDPEWCDTCGAPMTPRPAATPAAVASASTAPAPDLAGAAPAINCPACGDVNPASNLFCESCGLDFVTGQAPAPLPDPVATPADPSVLATTIAPAAPPPDPGVDLGWTATVSVDTDWFAVKGEGIGTPPTRAAHVIELRHNAVVIGRTRSSGANPGITIDDDHGISRRHAELNFHEADGTWSVTDLGSTNGTFVVAAGAALDASTAALDPSAARTLAAGDRVFVGAWSRIDLTNVGAGSGSTSPATSTATPDALPTPDAPATPTADPVVDNLAAIASADPSAGPGAAPDSGASPLP